MSAVRYTPLLVGDPRGAGPLNAIWTEIENAVPLSAVNFAEEGVDYRPLADHPVGLRTGLIEETTRTSTLATSATYTQYVHNGTTFRLTAPGDVPASLNDNEALRIRGRVWLETTLASGVGVEGRFGLLLSWRNGAAVATIAGSQREILAPNAGAGQYSHRVVFVEGWLFGPIPTINWVELRYKLIAPGTACPSKSMLWATRLLRINEV